MPDTSSRAAAPRRTVRDRLDIDAYLLRLDWHLEGMVPRSERKATIVSLRQDLMTDPRDVTHALADLGAPQVLASRYSDEGTRRPLWSIGAIIAGLALCAYWAVFFSFTGGMLAAVDSTGTARATSTFLSIPVEAFATADTFGIGWTSGWSWLLIPSVIVTVTFFAGARAWRISK